MTQTQLMTIFSNTECNDMSTKTFEIDVRKQKGSKTFVI